MRLLLSAAFALSTIAAPAAAQHARLEEAWTVCAKAAGEYAVRRTLEAEAVAAGFPKTGERAYAVRDGSGRTLVLSYEELEEDGDQCVVTSNGGDKAQMVERAKRFWAARGYRAYESSVADYAALPPPQDHSSLGVFLQRAPDSSWRMEVMGPQ